VESEQGKCYSALDKNKRSVILRCIRTREVSFCVVSEQGECHSALDQRHSAWDQNKGSVIVHRIGALECHSLFTFECPFGYHEQI
jgi:hypothetical protein